MEWWIGLEVAFFVKNHPSCPSRPGASVSLPTSCPEAVSYGNRDEDLSPRPVFILPGPEICFQAELHPLAGGQVETTWTLCRRVGRALGWKTRV